MNNLIDLLLFTLAVIAAVVVASYATVTATYWFESRHRRAVEPPELPALH